MKLIHNESGAEVKVGDVIQTIYGRKGALVKFSSLYITIQFTSGKTVEFTPRVINAHVVLEDENSEQERAKQASVRSRQLRALIHEQSNDAAIAIGKIINQILYRYGSGAFATGNQAQRSNLVNEIETLIAPVLRDNPPGTIDTRLRQFCINVLSYCILIERGE